MSGGLCSKQPVQAQGEKPLLKYWAGVGAEATNSPDLFFFFSSEPSFDFAPVTSGTNEGIQYQMKSINTVIFDHIDPHPGSLARIFNSLSTHSLIWEGEVSNFLQVKNIVHQGEA